MLRLKFFFFETTTSQSTSFIMVICLVPAVCRVREKQTSRYSCILRSEVYQTCRTFKNCSVTVNPFDWGYTFLYQHSPEKELAQGRPPYTGHNQRNPISCNYMKCRCVISYFQGTSCPWTPTLKEQDVDAAHMNCTQPWVCHQTLPCLSFTLYSPVRGPDICLLSHLRILEEPARTVTLLFNYCTQKIWLSETLL